MSVFNRFAIHFEIFHRRRAALICLLVRLLGDEDIASSQSDSARQRTSAKHRVGFSGCVVSFVVRIYMILPTGRQVSQPVRADTTGIARVLVTLNSGRYL